MVSDDDLVTRLTQVLEVADLTTTTTSAIRKQLENELGVDLSDRKAFIREQVDLFLQSRQLPEEPEDVPVDNYSEQQDEAEEEEGEDDGSSPEVEEPDSTRFKARINRAIKESLPREKKKRTGGGGLSKLCILSPELQAVVGETELSRTQVVKQLWNYIRVNNLQDPANKRKIICNDALRAVFGTESTDMFKMNKLLSKHLWPHDSAEGVIEGEPKPKKQREGEPKPKKQRVEQKEGGKRKASGMLAPLPLSDALSRFLGTGESELPRSEVVKRMWEYIKSKQLQDPADKRRIVCDNKLRQLLGCETFVGFGMTKLLSPHFLKSS